MRKVIFGGANSLDNYFAREDDSVDWLLWSDEISEIMQSYWKNFDTMVMGRRTYEVAMKSAPAPKKGSKKGKKAGNPFTGMKTYVFSRTLKPGDKDGVEIVNEDAGKFIRKLKRQKGQDICLMGGGNLAKSFFEAGVIDEIGFNIHPVLLGSGIPLFYEMKRQIDLELTECKALKNGCVMVTYRVKK